MCNIDKHLNKKQLVQYRLRVLQDANRYGFAKAARRYGVFRSTIYRWSDSVEPKKRGPKVVPWQTDNDTEELILQLKLATNYGPKRLVPELELLGVIVGEKAVRGVLERAEQVEHHKKKRVKKHQKFYAPYAGYRVQIDAKYVDDGSPDKRTTNRFQYTAIDIASKIRFIDLYESESTWCALKFAEDALSFYREIGINVECVQTDNHVSFTNLYSGGTKKRDHELKRVHPLTQYLLSRGIEHKLSRPGTPQHNGFVERSHRTDEEEFYRLFDVAGTKREALREAIKKWQFEYNYLRLHSSCQNMPPMKYYLNVLHTGA